MIKKNPNQRTITVRMDKELHEKLRALAAERTQAAFRKAASCGWPGYSVSMNKLAIEALEAVVAKSEGKE